MNYYRLHIGDYLRDTAHLSLLEHGVYARLLQVYYTREAPIADGEKYRVIGARSPEERAAVDAVLEEFFALIDGLWVQTRCERELEAYQAKAERNREVGRLGGRPPKNRNPDETQTVSTQNPDVTLANSQEPIAKEEKEEERANAPAPGGAPPKRRRATAIPDEFPDADALAWCRDSRSDLLAEQVAQVFRDYHLAHGSTMKDWRAAWRTWVGKERAPPRLGLARPTAHDRQAEVLARMTGGLMGRSPTDPRTIDVEPAAAVRADRRLTAGGG